MSSQRPKERRRRRDLVERGLTAGVEELWRGIVRGPEEYETADPELRPWLARTRRYHLALAEAFRHGADLRKIDHSLFRGSDIFLELHDARLLATLNDTFGPLQEVLSKLRPFVISGPKGTPQGSRRLFEALARVLELYQRTIDGLKPQVASLKLGRRRYTFVGDWQQSSGRESKLTAAGFVGDRAAAVYRLLADCIPLKRQWRGRPPNAAKYNQAALQLTAELVNVAYWPNLSRELTARDIKSRLQQRMRTSV